MKTNTPTLFLALALGLAGLTANAQTNQDRPPGDRPPGGDRPMREPLPPRQGNGPGRPDFHPPIPPLMAALDTDGDGVLSEKEISAASKSLKKLDKNKDGKITRDEIRPPMFAGGPQGLREMGFMRDRPMRNRAFRDGGQRERRFRDGGPRDGGRREFEPRDGRPPGAGFRDGAPRDDRRDDLRPRPEGREDGRPPRDDGDFRDRGPRDGDHRGPAPRAGGSGEPDHRPAPPADDNQDRPQPPKQ